MRTLIHGNRPSFVHAPLLAFVACVSCQALGAAPSLPATNDSSATFLNGMFFLPELKNPKDAYIVFIRPSDGSEPKKLELPQGTTGIRVSEKALPVTAWQWSYRLSADAPPALTLLAPLDLKLTPSQVPMTGKVLLTWKSVPGAASYSITGKSMVPHGPSLTPKESKIDNVCYASSCERNGIATTDLEAPPGSDITWRVTALDADKVPLAQSPEAHISVEMAAIQAAKERGFSVQQSDTLSKQNRSSPATLSYSSSSEGTGARKSAYQAKFAVIYDSPTDWNDFYPRVSLEAQLTSRGDDKPKDALILRAGGYKEVFRNPGKAEGTEWVSNLKYETERKSGTKKGLIETTFTPIYGILGTYRGPESFQVAPLLSLGAEAGKTFDIGSSDEKKDTIIRLRTSLRLDAEVPAAARLLGTRSVTAYVQGTYWHLPREDGQANFRFGDAGLSFGLTDYLSFDLSYGAGRKAPLFTFERSATAGLGLKF